MNTQIELTKPELELALSVITNSVLRLNRQLRELDGSKKIQTQLGDLEAVARIEARQLRLREAEKLTRVVQAKLDPQYS